MVIVLTMALAASAVPAGAHQVDLRYGPLEGYTFDLDGDHPHQEFYISVSPDVPFDPYYAFCIITDHEDGRGTTDTTCGETADCAIDSSACDDIHDPMYEGCASTAFESPVPVGDDEKVVLEIQVSYVDEASGATCLSGATGSVYLEMY